jgi:cytoskeletal protein CcmA (bactofilin family)
MAATKNHLSSDVEIKGILKFRSELTIDGKVEGEIFSQGALAIGENGVILGDIKTRSASIAGKVHGNVTAQERCELKSQGELLGDLKTPRLAIEDGAVFIGRSEVTLSKVSIMQPELVREEEPSRVGAA